ncbi:TPA: CatB-related O-acetyltransferase [Aeromonas salmonicida subsp. pectinolytica]|uniref:CatB-related O-acetyltransferase n=1 Tax=Aeromonas sp. QDB62 TaxID=2990499 RepID=UPI0022E16214|nr:CatB-related O-acetyltransferase [Aeromonas sp. QDB62]
MIRSVVGMFIKKIKLYYFKGRWRSKNSHNETTVKTIFNPQKVTIGNKTYGELNILSWGASNEFLKIGSYVSIAKNVTFILGGNHVTTGFMTYPVMAKLRLSPSDVYDSYSKGSIIVENDVWIGFGATILSGVNIGRGSVVAAGSVVTRSFPPYSIIGGNPARLIKMRFSDDVISIMSTVDVGSIDITTLSLEQIEMLYRVPDVKSKQLLGFL